MQKPNDSLEDYVVPPVVEPVTKPPRRVSLERTGEVEVLNPLARSETGTKISLKEIRAKRSYQPLWFRSFLAVGSFGLLLIAFALISAILVGINDESSRSEVASYIEPSNNPIADVAAPFDLPAAVTTPEPAPANLVRSKTTRKPVRPSSRVQVAYRSANRSTPRLRALPRAEVPTFTPTTLIIYAENGVINTRIEQGFQATYKKPLGLITY